MAEKIQIPILLEGQVIGEKGKYVVISEMSIEDLSTLVREIAKRESNFTQDKTYQTVECKIEGVSLFVEISFTEYTKLVNLYFQNRKMLDDDEAGAQQE